MNKADKKILDWAEFVATKFSSNVEGWTYTRDVGGLKHVRYVDDYTGYNHWTKRLKRAARDWNPARYFKPVDDTDRIFRDRKPTVRGFFMRAWIWSGVALRKAHNLPDGVINGIITNWEEDGEYIALFQPRVGVKVIEFIRANPNDQYAREILDEMKACAELSWPSKDAAVAAE